MPTPTTIDDLPAPAVVIDADALGRNLTTMSAAHPGAALRLHVTVWFLSDERLTFAPSSPVAVGDRVHVVPAHIDPTLAMHEVARLVRDGEVIDRWPIDLRGW